MSLRDYLQKRRSEIQAQISALKSELQEIKTAEDAISGATRVASAPASKRNLTIKDWVLQVLESKEMGLETDEVIEAVKEAGGPEVPRSSMTPQLSRLKAAGDLTQIGRHWMLPKFDFIGSDNSIPLINDDQKVEDEEDDDLL